MSRTCLLAVLLTVSCGAGPSGRETTTSQARGDDPWLVGARCAPDTPAEPSPRVEVLEAGTGQPVGPGMTVRVHYVASLPGGAVLHDSHTDSLPSEIVIGSTPILCGLERALVGMRPGEQRRVLVPWSLAFGDLGRPPEIPPRADLVFVIDLYLPADAPNELGMPPTNPGARGGGRRQ
jgi:hypothetical protein